MLFSYNVTVHRYISICVSQIDTSEIYTYIITYISMSQHGKTDNHKSHRNNVYSDMLHDNLRLLFELMTDDYKCTALLIALCCSGWDLCVPYLLIY